MSPTRREYCDIPLCPSCLGANPEICGCRRVMQSDYRGTIATTVDGEDSQAWSLQAPHAHTRTPENYPLSGLDSNYCRNSDGSEKAWVREWILNLVVVVVFYLRHQIHIISVVMKCYTTGSVRWNWCNVPNCYEQI